MLIEQYANIERNKILCSPSFNSSFLRFFIQSSSPLSFSQSSFYIIIIFPLSERASERHTQYMFSIWHFEIRKKSAQNAYINFFKCCRLFLPHSEHTKWQNINVYGRWNETLKLASNKFIYKKDRMLRWF